MINPNKSTNVCDLPVFTTKNRLLDPRVRALVASRYIKAGEEIFIDYATGLDKESRVSTLAKFGISEAPKKDKKNKKAKKEKK